MPMRRLCFILFCGLVAVPAALAGTSASGDGVLELRAVDANVVVTGSRGTLWGQMDRGKLVVNDYVLGDGPILVSGAEGVRQVSDNVTVYTGKDIHFRVTGGKYKMTFKGIGTDYATGIDFVAVGVGTAQITAEPLSVDPGEYAVDSGKWIPTPYLQRLVPFGAQTAVGGPATTP